ncbi:hypothetical protein BH11MYX1_BH11MYX1_39960 [soil metagenome]
MAGMKAEDRKVVWMVVGAFAVTAGVGIPVMYIADAEPTPHAKPRAAPAGDTNCPYHMSELALDDGVATCWCDGDYASTEPAIGTAQYHADSDPCGAAIHAGALSRYGSNRVTFRRTPGCAAYTSTRFNEKTSMAMQQQGDSKQPSYVVVGHGSADCSQSFNF